MALKKSELYSSLWASCDELRGGMYASQYKDYVLVLLFIKYVSDKYAGQPFAPITIPKGASFKDMVALKGKPDIGDQINKKIIAPLANANKLSDMPDFNDASKLGSGKEMVERLTNLIAIFENKALDFSKNRAEGDDILGDAYEYLMRHFATESGKSKGQFYTPAEVSRIIAQISGIHDAATTSSTTVYDPTCGSGSLLLKIGDEASARVTLYGQEKDAATSGLARMNMILHNNPTALVVQGNTLADPKFKDGDTLKTFDYVVANPPFSDKRWSTGLDPLHDPFERFKSFGTPPARQGDYAYLLHIVRSLKSTGKGACILPHGALFRGNAEADIRRALVRKGYIKGIIGMPANLFYGTGIPACIVVLDKEDAQARKGIFMIDASKGFIKDGNKNRLRAQDIHRIVDTFNRQSDVPRYSRMVPLSEISDPKNDFNLNLARYIESSEPEDLQDIEGHLRGGIPERDIGGMERYWKVFSAIRSKLFESAGRPGYLQLKVPVGEIRSSILDHEEFKTFNDTVTALFSQWRTNSAKRLMVISNGDKPKALIEALSEELLATFSKARLVDPYDVYQHLMDYWATTMQDDVYIISLDGWVDGARVRQLMPTKNKDGKTLWGETHDFKMGKQRFKSDLIPVALLIARFFTTEQAAIEALEGELGTLEQHLNELMEEHGNEGGLLEEVVEGEGDKRKITAKAVRAQLNAIGHDPDYAEERKALEDYGALLEKQVDIKSRLKTTRESLEAKVRAKYGKLTEPEIKALVIHDKWLATLAADVQREFDRVSHALTGRMRQLAERYETTLPQLTVEVATLAARVDDHLRRMGAAWE